jgi:MATE family multidrug resistance protein
MHSPAPSSKVTTAQVFAIAGPAMVANLTTPLIGIVSTTAIGRLGDATLLGGVAMASVLFDCMFWLFGFLRMSTVAFTAQSLGAGETSELRAILMRGLIVAAVTAGAGGITPPARRSRSRWRRARGTTRRRCRGALRPGSG